MILTGSSSKSIAGGVDSTLYIAKLADIIFCSETDGGDNIQQTRCEI